MESSTYRLKYREDSLQWSYQKTNMEGLDKDENLVVFKC